MAPPRVRCSTAMATRNFVLLVLQALKNKVTLLVLMLLEQHCPPGNPGGCVLQRKGKILPAVS